MKAAPQLAADRPVARVAVDTGVAHLDRPFDYAVPMSMAAAEPGCRVRVRFSGRLVDGFVLERCGTTEHEGRLAPLAALVSPERVLTAEVAALARVVADRCAGSLYDVLRLAVPPRHAKVEGEPAGEARVLPGVPEAATWERYATGPSYLGALGAGAPRAVWSALPGPTWPAEVATAVRTAAAAGRGALVVVPDARDAARVAAALGDLEHVELRADLGPAERYRRWLRVLRGEVRVVVGTRAAAFAPVRDLGLVVLWDDGDDLLAEPRAPYCHAREVLVHRAHLEGAAALVGGLARTAEGQLLVESGWASELRAGRDAVRATAPRVVGTSDEDLARDPVAQAARLPRVAFEAAREALAAGAPVLVQVPRRGYVPALVCQRDRTPARCPACAGPLRVTSGHAMASCHWCGRLAGDWRCPGCEGRQLRASVVGARRTAEELGRALPGVPVRTSGRDEVLAGVGPEPALVVATPGAEPVAAGGYGAVLLLDAWALLTRAELRAGEEALRRWMAAAALARPAAEGGRVVVVADHALAQVQALVRWDPEGAAVRELADRTALGFPPATRMVAVSGSPRAVADVVEAVVEAAGQGEVLGPVPEGDGERAYLRVPRTDSTPLLAVLRTVLATRSAHKAEGVRVQVDPLALA
ncbi:MAG TPA: primosomal protein N' [Mycobacteriales bacterium]|nr:primosomal protein N' [Mycobacteriales bacterium]